MAEARTWLESYVDPLGGGGRLRRPIDETLSMCSYLFPEGKYAGTFLATIFTTLEFVNDDIFDGADVYELLRRSPTGQSMAEDLRKIRAAPRLLAEGLLAGLEMIRNPSSTFRPVPFSNGISGDIFLHRAYHDFAIRLHGLGNRLGSASFRSWVDDLCDSLDRFALSHANIYKEIDRLSIEEYTQHKLVNCGMSHTIMLLELATETFLSREQHRHPLIAAIKTHCCHVGSLLNEIMSYEKEVFREKAGNLLLVIMLKSGADLPAATARVARLVHHHMAEVNRLWSESRVEFAGSDEESQALRRYVNGIGLLTAACWYWQVDGTTRYRSQTSPFAELLRDPADLLPEGISE